MAFFGWIIHRHIESPFVSKLASEATPDERRVTQLRLRKRALIRLIAEIEDEMLVLQQRIQYETDLNSEPIENVG
jgi:hypothetical protein